MGSGLTLQFPEPGVADAVGDAVASCHGRAGCRALVFGATLTVVVGGAGPARVHTIDDCRVTQVVAAVADTVADRLRLLWRGGVGRASCLYVIGAKVVGRADCTCSNSITPDGIVRGNQPRGANTRISLAPRAVESGVRRTRRAGGLARAGLVCILGTGGADTGRSAACGAGECACQTLSARCRSRVEFVTALPAQITIPPIASGTSSTPAIST